MSIEEQDISNWRLKYFFTAFILNALGLAIGTFGFGPAGKSTMVLFMLWAIAVGVSSTWLAIVHVLRCRAKRDHLWQTLFYYLPGVAFYLTIKFINLPIPEIK